MKDKKNQPQQTKREEGKINAEPLTMTIAGSTCVAGRYDLIEKIGKGGMGEIYSAMDRVTGEKVVVKFMIRSLAYDPESEKRFTIEAKAAAAIRHPNVIRIFDMDEAMGRPYIVMQHLHGLNLHDYLRQHGPLGWDKTREIMISVCNGIEAAHKAGIIHRDLKSMNIFVVNENGVEVIKVLDLGMAKFMDNSGGTLTAQGVFAGTPEYAAPEMLNDRDHIGAWTDIYALGIMMYDMMTGSLPFKSAKKGDEGVMDTFKMHLSVPPLPPSVRRPDLNIPLDAEKIILKCMEKKWSGRYQSAKELCEAILACEGSMGASKPMMSMGDIILQDSLRSKVAPGITDGSQNAGSAQAGNEKKGWFGKFVKTTLAIAAAGSITYISYSNWDRIVKGFDDMKAKVVQGSEKPVPSAAPIASADARAPERTFIVDIESDPPGAFVYDVTPKHNGQLGVTPLHRELAMGEYNIMVSSGRRFERLTVSPEHATARVVFKKEKDKQHRQGAETHVGQPDLSDDNKKEEVKPDENNPGEQNPGNPE